MNMNVTITLMPDGSVAIGVDNQPGWTDFDVAKAGLQTLLDRAGLAGAPITFTGEIERHVHTDQAPSVHTHASGMTHVH